MPADEEGSSDAGMLIILILCAAVSCIVCALLLRIGRANGRRYGLSMPQRFHAGHVPRLGGVAMMVACTVGWCWIVGAERFLAIPNQIRLPFSMALSWWVVAIIAVAGGVAEDLTHRLTAGGRLLCAVLAGAVGTLL